MLALWLAGRRRDAGACPGCGRRRPYVLLPPGRAARRGHDRAPATSASGTRSSCRCSWRSPRPAVVALRWRWAHVVTAVLVLFVAVSSLRTFPYYLPYSNEAFGGPARTHLHLHDSNVDWGQDLGRLGRPAPRAVSRASGSGWSTRAAACRPRTASTRPTRSRCRRTRCTGCSSSRTARSPRPTGRLGALIASSTPIDEVGHSITIFRPASPSHATVPASPGTHYT